MTGRLRRCLPVVTTTLVLLSGCASAAPDSLLDDGVAERLRDEVAELVDAAAARDLEGVRTQVVVLREQVAVELASGQLRQTDADRLLGLLAEIERVAEESLAPDAEVELTSPSVSPSDVPTTSSASPTAPASTPATTGPSPTSPAPSASPPAPTTPAPQRPSAGVRPTAPPAPTDPPPDAGPQDGQGDDDADEQDDEQGDPDGEDDGG